MSESFVVVILNRQKEPCGMGMVIDRDTVLTCAHVVNEALGRASDAQDRPTEATVDISFVFSGGERKGKIAHWYPPRKDHAPDDICVLRLTSSIPEDVALATLSPTERSRDFKACRRTGPDSPVEWGYGRIMDQADRGYYQVEPLAGKPFLSKGFSGSPIICVRTGNVLGMVVWRNREKVQGHIASTQNIQTVCRPTPKSGGVSRFSQTSLLLLVLWLLAVGGAIWGYCSVLERFNQSNAHTTSQIDQLEKELKELKFRLNDVPAAVCEMTNRNGQALDTTPDTTGPGSPRPVGTIIQFDYTYRATPGTVPRNPPWHFRVPKDGIYHISAFTACTQTEGAFTIGVCVNGKPRNTRPTVFLAEKADYKGGFIGGATDFPLTGGDIVDIRAYSMVPGATLVAVGSTHVSIHFVGPLPPKIE